MAPGNPGQLLLSAVRAPEPNLPLLGGVADVGELKARVREDFGEPRYIVGRDGEDQLEVHRVAQDDRGQIAIGEPCDLGDDAGDGSALSSTTKPTPLAPASDWTPAFRPSEVSWQLVTTPLVLRQRP